MGSQNVYTKIYPDQELSLGDYVSEWHEGAENEAT
jgi:hypothetical protein